MSGDSLRFEEIRIRRTPGFERGGFTIHGLSAGVNLIHGPNGSGKSTTARAIARLLWPGAEAERTSLSGRFRLGAEEWEVEVEGARALHRRSGADAAAPQLPPAQDQERYRLSLHDLLQARDAQFARAVERESAGGYDLRRAAAVLEPKTSPSRPRAALEELEDAQAAYDRAVGAQGALRADEDRLQELEREWAEADEASRRLGVLEAALEHARAREAEAVARAALEEYPAALGRVAGDEYDRLCGIRERLRRFARDAEEASTQRAEAREEAARCAIPDELRGEEVGRALESELGELREAERIAAEAARDIASCAAKLEAEGKGLGGMIAPERLAALDAPGMAALADFARRAGGAQARRGALEARLLVLGDPTDSEDVAALEEAVRCLHLWLRSPAPAEPATGPSGVRTAGLIGAALLICLGVVLAVILSIPWLIVTLAGLVLLWPLLRSPATQPAGPGARLVHQREFEKRGFESPTAWEGESVERLLETLQKRALAARRESDAEQRRAELREELRRHVAFEEEIGREGSALAARFGLSPAPDPVQLVLLAERVARWQTVRGELLAAQETARLAADQREVLASALRGKLQRLGYRDLESTGEIAGAIGAFAERRRRLVAAEGTIAGAERTLVRLEGERAEAATEMARIFEALELDPDTDETVKDWCSRRKGFLEARDRHHSLRAALEAAARRLAERGSDPALTEMPPPELGLEIEQARARAAMRDERAREIAAIRARVEDAKRSHGIEEALERRERAREELRRAREKDVRGMVATELIAHVEQATRDRLLPAVFHRAREIFIRITRGRYELRLRREGEPEFVAFDTEERRERTLDELSSGNRVQLLIAVRVAFVEQQEHGVRLPLILDEVLGNSDDERARAVMEAALELAAEGRQIFYFTAQADEVARWRNLAGSTSVEVHELDLAELRGMAQSMEIPPLPVTPLREPPAPAAMDHHAYARALNVPALERAVEEVGSVHLWYLTEDPETLHHLLLLGPERWGSLEALLRNGGRTLVEPDLVERLEIAARVTEAFLGAARVGVGPRVDRSVLEDSGAVSAIFLDRISALADQHEGDAERLLDALEQKAISGFRRKSLDELTEYLEANGYRPPVPPLEPGEIRGRVIERMAQELASGRVTIGQIDRLVGRLWLGIGGG